MLKSFFPCTAPMLATLLTTALNLAAQYREFEAAATAAASVQLFTKYTGVSFVRITNTLIPTPICPLWSQCSYRHQFAHCHSRYAESILSSYFHYALNEDVRLFPDFVTQKCPFCN